MAEARTGRFLVGPDKLRVGRVEIDVEPTRHMRVRRLTTGDTVVLFDGAGREATALIEQIGPTGAVARVDRIVQSRGESPLRVVLVQALPVKLPRMDEIVRQCTEVGVARIVPVLAGRSQEPGGGRGTLDRRVERWRRIAGSASQQSGRGEVPMVDDVGPLDEALVDALPELRLLLDPGAEQRLSRELVDRSPLALLVGPEGGWTEEELGWLRRTTVAAGLGPRVLRADTAGAVAIGMLQLLAGDVGDTPLGEELDGVGD